MPQETNQASVAHSTYSIERTYPVPSARVFAAFAHPATKRRWFAEGEEWKVEEYALDFRVGGRETVRFSSTRGGPIGDTPLRNDSFYLDIVPDRRIVVAYTMTVGERRISASLATVELAAAGDGTRLTFTEQAAFFEGADGVEIREQGWRALLDKLGLELRKR